MKLLKNTLAVAAAFAMAGASAAAVAAPAAKPAVSKNVRASAPVRAKTNKANTGLAVGAVVVIAGGIVLLADNNGKPKSP